MKVLGINTLSHDSSICLLTNDSVSHVVCSDRSTTLDDNTLRAALDFDADIISYFERPWLKKSREVYSGNWPAATIISPKSYLRSLGFTQPIKYQLHHKSHAAYGLWSAKKTSAIVFVIDAIGEWDCTSVWDITDNKFKCIKRILYPKSLGLFYSAFTKLFGFKPNAEEHKFYQKGLRGDPDLYYNQVVEYFKTNVHQGVKYKGPINSDLAASVQKVFEKELEKIVRQYEDKKENAIFVGGCSLNACVRQIGQKYFREVHIPPKPGDVSSSIGAAYLALIEK